MRPENVFTTFLKLLEVKHTLRFSNKYFNEHPHKYDLYGISKMLSDYGVENESIKLGNKNDLFKLELPFIAHISTSFVVVYKITSENVHYIWEGKDIKASLEGFFDVWTEIVLIAESNANSIEPNYKKNKKKELLQYGQRIILGIASVFLVFYSFFTLELYKDIGTLLLFALNAAGVYFGYLLVLKQLNVQNRYGDKICSLFKQSDCNDILNSKAARLGDVIGWSEIGLGYFFTNIAVLLFLPSLLPYVSIVNIFTLPFTIWSIWYQKIRAKQWCPLCLCVLAVLWMMFFVNVIFNYISFQEIGLTYIYIGCLYLVSILALNLLLPMIGLKGNVEQITQELRSLKSKEEVFYSLLKSQAYYPVDKRTSRILFGNLDAENLITVITNPHCEPCAKLHERIDTMFKQGKRNFCVQYLFLNFPNLESSNLFLIGFYLRNGIDASMKVYTEWFNQGGKYTKDSFFLRYSCDLTGSEIVEEFEAHQKWGVNSKLNTTPTILVNGFQLPSYYHIEDLMEVL